MESKDIIDDIERKIMEGYTITKYCELTGITEYYARKAVEDLNRPKSGIYDEEHYKRIKAKIKENSAEYMRRVHPPKIDPSLYKNYIDDIEKSINNGNIYEETERDLGLPVSYVPRIINALNDPNSDIHDEERYKKIIKKRDENTCLKQSLSGKKVARFTEFNKRPDLAKSFANRIIKGDITILDAAKLRNMSFLEALWNLINIKDEELKKGLYPYLESYGVWLDFSDKNSKKLKSYSVDVKKEMALMALTYRVSFTTLARMLHTSVLDIIETFRYLDTEHRSLSYLFLETINEDENMQKLAYYNAKLYMSKRNKLMRSLIEAKGDETKKSEIKAQFKELYLEINNDKVFETIGKPGQSLTQEEKDLIARYPLKYHMSLNECEEILKRHRNFIKQCIEDLASRNMIFKEKFALHNQEFQELYSFYQTLYNPNNPNNYGQSR